MRSSSARGRRRRCDGGGACAAAARGASCGRRRRARASRLRTRSTNKRSVSANGTLPRRRLVSRSLEGAPPAGRARRRGRTDEAAIHAPRAPPRDPRHRLIARVRGRDPRVRCVPRPLASAPRSPKISKNSRSLTARLPRPSRQDRTTRTMRRAHGMKSATAPWPCRRSSTPWSASSSPRARSSARSRNRSTRRPCDSRPCARSPPDRGSLATSPPTPRRGSRARSR